jgi:hypothetical protein
LQKEEKFTNMSKRPRDEEDMMFRVELSHPNSLRLMAENISHIVKIIELRIVSNDEFQGIRVEMLDDLKACLVIGELPCDVSVSPRWLERSVQSVSVSIESLLLTLRQIENQQSLVIEQGVSQDDIVTIRSVSPMGGGDELHANLHLIVSTPTSNIIELKEFPILLQVEMDLPTVRSFLKTCESIKSEDVQIVVTEYDSGDRTVTIKSTDQATMSLQKTFLGTSETGEDSIISELTSREGSVIFDESFSTKYMNNFLRSMNRTLVTLKMAPSKPLHIFYPLGSRESSLTFILAPRVKG